ARGADPLGVIASGFGFAYVQEALRDLGARGRVWTGKIGVPYPLSEELITRMLDGCEKILVVEEGDPLVEAQVRLLAQASESRCAVAGKMFAGELALTGELSTDKVIAALASLLSIPLPQEEERRRVKAENSAVIPPRSSTLCAGCPHLGTYWAINQVIKNDKKHMPVLNGDIGCYEQGGYGIKGQMPVPSDAPAARYPSKIPYDMLDTIYIMGSGISMAQGQARSGFPDGRYLAVAGDSTFFHTCMPGLLNAVWNDTKVTFVVMDNAWTAMTGHQICPATGMTPRGDPAEVVKIEAVAGSMGVKSVVVADPYHLDDVMRAVREAVEFDGVAVVVARGECILQVVRREGKTRGRTLVTEDCTGCKICTEIGCPAITFKNNLAGIDELLCVNCGICAQACPDFAIVEQKVREGA
ncbi:MAG TPA: thiamine pyrophosphate-dependent enzyme, partial [Anaerolineaceae bacterium]